MTKTRRGKPGDEREVDGRIHHDKENEDTCPVMTILRYQSRKTVEQLAPDFPFFLCVKQSAREDPIKVQKWFTKSRMGINSISKLPRDVFEPLGVDCSGERVSATSYRKLMAQCGADGGVSSVFLSKLMGQKNLDSKLSYTKNKKESHKAASLVITRRAVGKSVGVSFPEMFEQLQQGPSGVDKKRRAAKRARETETKEDDNSSYEEEECEEISSSSYQQQSSGPAPQHQQMSSSVHSHHVSQFGSNASQSMQFSSSSQMLMSPQLPMSPQMQMGWFPSPTSLYQFPQLAPSPMLPMPMQQVPIPVYQQRPMPLMPLQMSPNIHHSFPVQQMSPVPAQQTSQAAPPQINHALRDLTNTQVQVSSVKKGNKNVKNPGFRKDRK